MEDLLKQAQDLLAALRLQLKYAEQSQAGAERTRIALQEQKALCDAKEVHLAERLNAVELRERQVDQHRSLAQMETDINGARVALASEQAKFETYKTETTKALDDDRAMLNAKANRLLAQENALSLAKQTYKQEVREALFAGGWIQPDAIGEDQAAYREHLRNELLNELKTQGWKAPA